MQAVLLIVFVSDDAGVGRAAPLHPLGDEVREGFDPLALSRELGWREFGFLTMREAASVEMLVFGGAKGCSDEGLVSDDTSVGRSAPLHPLGRRGARGFTPLSRSPGSWVGGNLDF